MALRICVLASGSSGNCTYVSSETTAILIDAGLSGRETARRLELIGAQLDAIRGVCVSHEHNDHTAGLKVLHQRHGIPIYVNSGTVDALKRDPKHGSIAWSVFSTGTAFGVGDLRVHPFSVPHDAMEPVGFVISGGGVQIGVVTDIGVPTSLARERLRHCQVIVIEANHDEQMLHAAERPWSLKQRILGRQGHLSNAAASAMLAEIAGPGLKQVFLAHLSRDCNRHDLALDTASGCLGKAGHHHVKVSLTYPDRVSEVWVG